MEHYTDDSIIRRLAGYCDGGYYKQGCNNKTIDAIQPKFTNLDALLIKLWELRR